MQANPNSSMEQNGRSAKQSTSNKTARARHAKVDERAVRAMRKEILK
jgi:hypothetical protein